MKVNQNGRDYLKSIKIIGIRQFREVFRLLTTKIWIALCLLLITAFAIGARAEHFPNGVIWSLFGRDIPEFTDYFLKVFIAVIFQIGLMFFVPVGVATLVYENIDTPIASYYLSRPISRSQIALGGLVGAFMAYTTFIVATLVLLAFGVWVHSGEWLALFGYRILLFVPEAWALHAFLTAAVLLSRSAATGTVAYLGYVFLFSYLLKMRTAGVVIWEKVLNIILDGLNYILPPLDGLTNLSGQSLETLDAIILPILTAMLSVFVFSAVGVLIYKRLEF
ncbi:MAG: hypothetical protein D6743_12005 [Calditrichaeota bacterium]|nr:MAG: hypothetical protein D6743_12005 [Calditrichota bacterium]